jgi:hypothetical protein
MQPARQAWEEGFIGRLLYLVPAAFVCDYCAPWIAGAEGQLVRFHIEIEAMERFKNNWLIVEERLGPWAAPES